MKMKIEIRNDKAVVSGYVNAVGRDSRPITDVRGKFVEQIEPGAFRASLERSENVDLLLNHDKSMVYASTKDGSLKLTEDSIGLRAEAVLSDAEMIRKARSGEFRGWSFGMYVGDSAMEERAEGIPRRHVKSLNMFEVSLIDKSRIPCYVGTSVEMQLNERKISTDTAICALFGVPYDMLTGKASEAVKVRFFENACMPVINAIEAALDSDSLLEAAKDHRYWAFDTREATRGDIQSRYNAYAVALQNNFLQLDEVRKLEDLEPLGFNFLKLGLNDVLLDTKTGRIYTPNTNAMVDMGSGAGAVMNMGKGDEDENRDQE